MTLYGHVKLKDETDKEKFSNKFLQDLIEEDLFYPCSGLIYDLQRIQKGGNLRLGRNYSRQEAERLMKNGRCVNVRVHHRHGYSWTVIGTKP